MRGDYCDSSSDEDNFNTKAMFEERYCNRKKMKEYLLKWKGYSSMNNVSKLEADLEYDALISDYNVHKKKKKWRNSKSHSGVSSSSYFEGRAYMIPYRGDRDNLLDAVPTAKPSHHQISCKGPKYSAFMKEEMGDNNLDASNETDEEYDSQRLRMLPSLGQSGIEKGWIPERIMSTFPVDNDFPLTYVVKYRHMKKVERVLSSVCRTYWPDMVASLYKRYLNEESGISNDDDKPMP